MNTINWVHQSKKNQSENNKSNGDILFKWSLPLDGCKHSIHLAFEIVVRDIIQVEVQADMNNVALKPVMQMSFIPSKWIEMIATGEVIILGQICVEVVVSVQNV
jgi:hypothetical protein